MSDGLALASTVVEAMLAHACDELPNEACGLLSGRPGRALRFHPARNALASRYAYEVEPGDLVRIMYAIEADAEELVGIFHSHPATPAIPSASDVREAEYPVVYLIASFADPEAPGLRGWRIEAGNAREVRVTSEAAQQPPVGTWSMISPRRASSTRSRPQEPSSPPER